MQDKIEATHQIDVARELPERLLILKLRRAKAIGLQFFRLNVQVELGSAIFEYSAIPHPQDLTAIWSGMLVFECD